MFLNKVTRLQDFDSETLLSTFQDFLRKPRYSSELSYLVTCRLIYIEKEKEITD